MSDPASALQVVTPEHRQNAKVPSAARNWRHSLFETVVFVDVGPEQKRYAIHKGLLCSRSGYFKAALTGNFQEAEDQVVTLDDEDPKIFRRFNAWLYTDVLVEAAELESISTSSIFEIYFFAEKRIIPLLQNAAIDAILCHNTYHSIPATQIRDVWTRTTERSRLRKLVVDSRLKGPDEHVMDQFENRLDEYDITFVAAVAMRTFELMAMCSDINWVKKTDIARWLRDFNDPWEGRCLRYHTHEPSDPPCGGRP